jgi:hypothetical protein
VSASVSLVSLVIASALQGEQPTNLSFIAGCDSHEAIIFKHKNDLPQGVLAALGFDMADADEPFQVTDVIMQPGLPEHRFNSAQQTCNLLTLNYETGGIAHTHDTALLERAGDKWILRQVKQDK